MVKVLDRPLDPANVDKIAADAEDHWAVNLSFPHKRNPEPKKPSARPSIPAFLLL